jgi:hypothetical protein
MRIKIKITKMEERIITEEVQQLLTIIKKKTQLGEELQEILILKDNQIQNKMESLQVQVTQLKGEIQRLNHL